MDTLIKQHYWNHGYDFEWFLKWHHANGFVIDLPDAFAMGYVYKDCGVVCHVSYAGGDKELLIDIASKYNLDFLEFERNFNGKVKRYDMGTLARRL